VDLSDIARKAGREASERIGAKCSRITSLGRYPHVTFRTRLFNRLQVTMLSTARLVAEETLIGLKGSPSGNEDIPGTIPHSWVDRL